MLKNMDVFGTPELLRIPMKNDFDRQVCIDDGWGIIWNEKFISDASS